MFVQAVGTYYRGTVQYKRGGAWNYMDNRIKCSVSNCVYWQKGNDCTAQQILVTSDANASSVHDVSLLSSATPQAGHSSDTCCKTFKDKGGTSGITGSYHGSGGTSM